MPPKPFAFGSVSNIMLKMKDRHRFATVLMLLLNKSELTAQINLKMHVFVGVGGAFRKSKFIMTSKQEMSP